MPGFESWFQMPVENLWLTKLYFFKVCTYVNEKSLIKKLEIYGWGHSFLVNLHCILGYSNSLKVHIKIIPCPWASGSRKILIGSAPTLDRTQASNVAYFAYRFYKKRVFWVGQLSRITPMQIDRNPCSLQYHWELMLKSPLDKIVYHSTSHWKNLMLGWLF